MSTNSDTSPQDEMALEDAIKIESTKLKTKEELSDYLDWMGSVGERL